MLESFVKLTDVNEVNVSREERWASLAGGVVADQARLATPCV